MYQPAQYEPPYSAMCLPAARGEGSIADDVYSLGVLLLVLALGRVPMAELDEASVLRRKVELGAYHALVGEARLPQSIADLARGMLAEDPDHRPPPALLLDPAAARSRRVAARPPRRAQRPITLAGLSIWDAHSLAFALAIDPEQGLAAMTAGTVTQWLRRGLGDASLGSRVEEMVRHRHTDGADEHGADAFVIMRVIILLDPLAPVCWRGIAVWPDAIGPALAAALGVDGRADIASRLEEIIAVEAVGSWATLRSDGHDHSLLRIEARQSRATLQSRGPAGGMPRLLYALCPLLPCASQMLGRQWVANVEDMPLALELVASTVDRHTSPIDSHIAAFLAARAERRLDTETSALTSSSDANSVALARLRLLAQLQLRYCQRPLPALSAWVAEHCEPLVASWHNRPLRAVLGQKLRNLAEAGFLPPMVALFDDAEARAVDTTGAHQAAEAVIRIDAQLRSLAKGGEERGDVARRIGQEIAAGAGMAALATMLALAALG